jgi:hypothetical protein
MINCSQEFTFTMQYPLGLLETNGVTGFWAR